jgi:NAD(P)-dependent dehydrogenase (short-subunit alcohol dehydrogenase family)
LAKLALVTGAAQPLGIGYSSALALVELGYDVIVTGLSKEEISLTPAHDRISAITLDITSDDDVKRVIAGLPRLDALVNCAGRTDENPDEFNPGGGFLKTININLVGTMRMCTEAHDLLARQGGSIINMGSMYSFFGSALWPGYAASRGALVQLTKSLARAWAPEGIRVNAVAPGFIKTNGSRPLWENEEFAEFSAQITGRTPMGRWGEPQEVGDVIGFLCSPAARFVTGVLLPIDGGYTLVG